MGHLREGGKKLESWREGERGIRKEKGTQRGKGNRVDKREKGKCEAPNVICGEKMQKKRKRLKFWKKRKERIEKS